MTYTATQLITQALRDLCELRTGQTTSPDILADCLTEANEMVDEWALERIFCYLTGGATFTGFADLTTPYSFAAGSAAALRKNIAARVAPMMKIHFKIPEPLLQEIAADAQRTKQALLGVAAS